MVTSLAAENLHFSTVSRRNLKICRQHLTTRAGKLPHIGARWRILAFASCDKTFLKSLFEHDLGRCPAINRMAALLICKRAGIV